MYHKSTSVIADGGSDRFGDVGAESDVMNESRGRCAGQ